MGQLNRMTVTEANREFTRMLSNVDKNDVLLLTKQGNDKYAVVSMAVFNDLKEGIMKGYIITDDLMDNIANNGTFKDERGKICKVWVENDEVNIIKITEESGEVVAFSYGTVPVEGIDIKKDGKITVEVHSSKDYMVRVSAYDAEEISEEDYREYSMLMMAEKILKDIGDTDKLPEGCFRGVRALEI